MSESSWNWNAVLASPSFWSVYFELYVDEDEIEGEDSDDEQDEAEQGAEECPRLTARDLFGDQYKERSALEAELHNHWGASLGYYRNQLAKGPDFESVLEQIYSGNPMLQYLPNGREELRANLLAAQGPSPANKVLALPLSQGFSLEIEFVPAMTLFYLLGQGKRVLLGHHSGHHALPALRWEEIFEIERQIAGSWQGDFPQRYASLLLYAMPWTSPYEDIEPIRERVREGIQRAGVVVKGQEENLLQLLTSPVRDLGCNPESAPDGREGFVWWQDRTLGWINNSPYSPRNPESFFSEELKAQDGFEVLRQWNQALLGK